MRTIDKNSIILKQANKTIETYSFKIIYADGTGLLCKICAGDSVTLRCVYNDEYITIEGGILDKYVDEILYIRKGSTIYKVTRSNLIYIYNETTIRYNFDITNYQVGDVDIIIPDDNNTDDKQLSLFNVGDGTTILSQLALNKYSFKTIKQGDGINVSTDGSTITIASSRSSQPMSDQDVNEFISLYVK